MDSENIVHMPTLLERLASKLKTCLTQEANNRQEWVAIQEAKCATLVEIRDQFANSDAGFGQWCKDNGFGADVLNDDTRAACIAMGRDPVALRACLEASMRRSLHTIYKYEFDGFRTVSKPLSRRKKSRQDTKVEAVSEAIRPTIEAGATLNRTTWAKELGVGEATIQRAQQYELGRLEGLREQPPLDPDAMRQNMRARYDATVRATEKRLTIELTDKIRTEVYQYWDTVVLPHFKQKFDRAEKIVASHQGVMSRDLFRRIKACLHPDHNTFTFAAEALQAFSELEKVLVKPDEVTPTPSGLPKTAAEMMARRREYQRRR